MKPESPTGKPDYPSDDRSRSAPSASAMDDFDDGSDTKVVLGNKNRDDTEMDMTPMVDVTFLLLIFFMVTAAFTLQKSIPLPTPKPDEPSSKAIPKDEQDPSTLTVIVDSLNTYRVISNDWEAEAPSEQEMRIKVRDAARGDSTGTKPTKVVVKAHVDALHARVVAAIDAAADAQISSIQYMIIEEDE